jgi:hypothetical protein
MTGNTACIYEFYEAPGVFVRGIVVDCEKLYTAVHGCSSGEPDVVKAGSHGTHDPCFFEINGGYM